MEKKDAPVFAAKQPGERAEGKCGPKGKGGLRGKTHKGGVIRLSETLPPLCDEKKKTPQKQP